jgi:hypothetical protein
MGRVLDWPCWDPNILVNPSEVERRVWAGLQMKETTEVSNPGQGKLAWAINSGPIHLWALTDSGGEVPTFLNNLDPTLLLDQPGALPLDLAATAAITDEVQLDVCAVSTGVGDCCAGSTCTAAELLDQDVLIIYNDQPMAGPAGLGNMLADYVDQGGTVILAKNALVQGADGLGGRFMSEDYSPLKSSSSTSAGAASLDTYDAAHPLMSGVSSAGALAHLDVFTTSGDVEVIATWDSGEPFVAIKRQDPAPIQGRVIAVNAPLEDGQWSGDLDEIVTNAIQWLSDNIRDLPWLEPLCSPPTPLPLPDPFGTPVVPTSVNAVNYTCPLVDSGGEWALTLNFDGSEFNEPPTATLRGKVTIEHNVAGQGRVNIPVVGSLLDPYVLYLPILRK